jgi:APA family basic amino acid/polyamine antiporter
MTAPLAHSPLARRLGLRAAVVVGLGGMLGAGVFVVLAPAADAAGSALLLGLLFAGALAACNATSSARLAARHPESGGAYVYGRERLSPFWGYLAGWCFVVGKSASCAAMALTLADYLDVADARPIAAIAVVLLTTLAWSGVQRSARATAVGVALVLLVLAAVVTAGLAGGEASTANLTDGAAGGVRGVLVAAGFCFFAFAGYARLATLGEEVRDPARTIPRAITVALAVALVVYAVVAVTALAVLGVDRLAASTAPLADVAATSGWPAVEPVVRAGAVLACASALLGLLLGVSRTTLALARDGHLPRTLAAVHPTRRNPAHAELAVGAVVALVVLVADVRDAIGFSAVTVLTYYAVVNAAAWTLDRRVLPRAVAAVGLAGCAAVVLVWPASALVPGVVVVLAGAAWWFVAGRLRRGFT